MSAKTCTEFCSSDCDGDHHAVLIALTKVHNKETLVKFRQVLRAYQIHGFLLEIGVPDPRPSFRYPILHWAAVLGKIEVIKLLLKAPFNVNPQLKSSDGETALHRVLNIMDGKAKLPAVFLEIVGLLQKCSSCVDNEQKTPFHICADIINMCQKRELYQWKEVFCKMINAVDNKKYILNCCDNSGETVLHILSKREESLDLIEYLLCLGGKFDVINEAGETPVEVAWRFSMHTYNFYQMIKSTSVMNEESDESDYSADNLLGEVRTRASLGLSETKDYTQFFDEEIKSASESDNDGEDESLKRKKTQMNISLINRLDELSKSPSPVVNTRCNKPPRKRRIIMSDDSSDDNNIHDAEESLLQSKVHKTPENCHSHGDVKITEQHNSKQSEDKNNLREERELVAIRNNNLVDDKHTVIKHNLQEIGIELKDSINEEQEVLSEEQILQKIKDTIKGIKELYESDSSDDDDGDDDDNNVNGSDSERDVNEEEINTDSSQSRDKILDRKIHVLEETIKEITSL